MAYEKHTWACGEVVTAEKLNQMEDGIADVSECCEQAHADIEEIKEQLDGGSVEIVSFASATDEQFAAMVAALDAGKLTVEETGWQVGDERQVTLSAMAADGVGESHEEQTVTFVIMDSGHYDLVGGGKDHFVLGLKDCLNEKGYMNSTNTNAGSWDDCARRTWCNNVFRNAIPETLRGCFKQFETITAETYNGTALKTSEDYFALFAEKEVFGARTYSNETEADPLTQDAWYETSANRIKNVSGSASVWWERSPNANNSNNFCNVNSSGSASGSVAGSTRGLAPFGCI